MLKGKKIILGVSAGVAIYKSLEICRQLIKKRAAVRIVMTENSAKLISPTLFEAISRNQVLCRMFENIGQWNIEHVSIAQWGDLMLVAPATANIIGKFANGIADDALSTVFLACAKPVLIAPAMNDAMLDNAAVQENLKNLHSRGVTIIAPGVGELACGTYGSGRLAEIDEILSAVKDSFIDHSSALNGKQVLINAGPTREAIDPVRFISNPSSGKMGYALANEMCKRGAKVTLVTGPVSIDAPRQAKVISTETASQMCNAMKKAARDKDIIIFAAAVADYRPKVKRAQKIKKTPTELSLPLVRTLDIAQEVLKVNSSAFRVGFAAESTDLIKNATKKLRVKKFDLVVANNISSKKRGFESDFNKITLIDKTGKTKRFPTKAKAEVARIIADEIERRIQVTSDKGEAEESKQWH